MFPFGLPIKVAKEEVLQSKVQGLTKWLQLVDAAISGCEAWLRDSPTTIQDLMVQIWKVHKGVGVKAEGDNVDPTHHDDHETHKPAD